MVAPCKYCGRFDPPGNVLFTGGRLDHELCILREQTKRWKQVVEVAVAYRGVIDKATRDHPLRAEFIHAVDAYLQGED